MSAHILSLMSRLRLQLSSGGEFAIVEKPLTGHFGDGGCDKNDFSFLSDTG